MNFEEYWKSIDISRIEGFDLEVQDYSKMAWVACKDEVLKILENNQNWGVALEKIEKI